MDLHIEKFWMANEGIPTPRRVELHIVLQVLLLTRHPCEHNHYSFNLSARLVSMPVKLTPKSPHLLSLSPQQKKKSGKILRRLEKKTPTKNKKSCLTREFPGIANGGKDVAGKVCSLILSLPNFRSFMPPLDDSDFSESEIAKALNLFDHHPHVAAKGEPPPVWGPRYGLPKSTAYLPQCPSMNFFFLFCLTCQLPFGLWFLPRCDYKKVVWLQPIHLLFHVLIQLKKS